MAKKMSWEGIGPKLALSMLPYLALVITIMVIYPDFLKINFIPQTYANLISIIWGAIGIIFYIITSVTFFRVFYKNKLITTGPFALSRNPIYASFIIFFIPALAVYFRSWLLLSAAVALYLNFKILIKEENTILESIFGKEYLDYKKRVNELLPLPKLRKS